MSAEGPNARFSITMPNRKAEIEHVQQAFRAFADEHAFSQPDVRKINIALDELLTNITSYAHPEGGEHDVYIEFKLRAEELTLSISDNGVAFDPFAAREPDTSSPLEERQIGGLGLHLVPNLVDEAKYERRSGKNVVTLVKVVTIT